MRLDTEPRCPTAAECTVVAALLECDLPPISADLRFLHDVDRAAACAIPLMNPGRRACLYRIAMRYRNRLLPEIRDIADGLRPGKTQ